MKENFYLGLVLEFLVLCILELIMVIQSMKEKYHSDNGVQQCRG